MTVYTSTTAHAEVTGAGVVEGEIAAGRRPNKHGVALGDLVCGSRLESMRLTVGVVEKMEWTGSDWHGYRYTVRVADLFPTGDVERATLHNGVGVIVPAGSEVRCAACGETHVSPDRFVDCLVAHVRADRERVACGFPRGA